ncbi:MAG TPA: hypothetical protein VGF67_28335 [Ktedonobacteraceae bacterium]|jgi:hypothetical protein
MLSRPESIHGSRARLWLYLRRSGLFEMLVPVRNRLSQLSKGFLERGKPGSVTNRQNTGTSEKEASRDAARIRESKPPIKKERIVGRPTRKR